MKKIFWTTIFWAIVLSGFLAYIKWFDQDLGKSLESYIIDQEIVSQECPVVTDNTTILSNTGDNNSGTILPIENQKSDILNTKLDEIKQQLTDISEKLDIQNSNTPDAVSVSLKTTKKTNVWIFPLDGSEYRKYVMPASDDILRDTLSLLFDKSAFSLKDTKLDNDGNLAITLERVPGSTFGGSAAVEQTKTSIEKTALQFSQIKKVTITPEEILQP